MKYIIPIITLVLAGCQATTPDNPNDNLEHIANTIYTSNTIKAPQNITSIAKPSYIENDNKKPGEYPQQYQYIIANQIKAQPITLFKPIPYVTSKFINGWGTCYINPAENFNEYFLAIIKNNKIIETFSSTETFKTCESIKEKQIPLEQAKEKALQEDTIKNFTSIVDNPEKFHLFGEAPTNPEKIMKSQLNFFLEDPQSAEIKNVSVRKTFLISQDNIIYCYLVFANIRTKNIATGIYKPFQKAVFYIKDDKVLEHKIFPDTNSISNSGLKPKKQTSPVNTEEENIHQENYQFIDRPRVRQTIVPNNKSTQKSSTKKAQSNKKIVTPNSKVKANSTKINNKSRKK